MTQTSASGNAVRILCVMSDEQQQAYASELDAMRAPSLDFVFEPSGDEAIGLVGEVEPALVIVGMDIGDMEGLEFVALMMNQYKDFSNKIIVLPDKGDPFPPVVQHRNNSTGQSSTKNIALPEIRKLVHSLAPAGAPMAVPAPLAAAAPLQPAPPPPAAPAAVPPGGSPSEPVAAAPVEPDPVVSLATPQEMSPPSPAIAEPPPDPLLDGPSPPSSPASAAGPVDDGFAAVDGVPPLESTPGRSLPRWIVPAAVLVAVAAGVAVMSSSGDSSPEEVEAVAEAAAPAEEAAEPEAAPTSDEATAEDVAAKDDEAPEAVQAAAAVPTGAGLKRGKLTTLPLRFAKGRVTYTVTDAEKLATIVARLLTTLKQSPDAHVEVGGHASNDGTGENNVALGRRRAIAIRKYVIDQGVAAERIKVRNYHTSKAATAGGGPASQRGDRRVTLLVR